MLFYLPSPVYPFLDTGNAIAAPADEIFTQATMTFIRSLITFSPFSALFLRQVANRAAAG